MSENTKTTIKDLGYSSPKEFIEALDKMARSKGYEFIRDNVTPQMIKEIREADVDGKSYLLYQTFQEIKMECKKSHEYDMKVPTMLDVNRGLTNLYSIVLNLLKAHKSDTDATLGKICSAINKIEEKIGVEQTIWDGGAENVTDDTGNGKSVPSSGDGIK